MRLTVGIVAFVVDDEAGVHRDTAIGRINIDGVGVTANMIFGFVERYTVALGEQPGCRQSGDSGANNRDVQIFHSGSRKTIPETYVCVPLPDHRINAGSL